MVVTCFAHVPFPIVLVFEGVNLHSAELVFVVQDPVYTDISPSEDIEGINESASLLKNGRFGVIVWSVKLERLSIDDMLSDTNWAEPEAGRNAYATS